MHWLNKDFESKSISLTCKRFGFTHSFEAIGRIINDIHGEYGRNLSNLVATPTANGSNFVKAFKEFGVVSEVSNKDDANIVDCERNNRFKTSCFETTFTKSYSCVTHTLNLVATTDFNEILKSWNFICEKHKQVSQIQVDVSILGTF